MKRAWSPSATRTSGGGVGVGVGRGVGVGVSEGMGVGVMVGRGEGVGVGGIEPGREHAKAANARSRRGRSSFFIPWTIHGRGRGVKERVVVSY